MMMKSRIIRMMLCAILMVTGLLFLQVPVRAEDVYSGTTGDCTWEFDRETSTLTISGSGATKEYTFSSYPEWRSYKDTIKKIVVEDGVTRLGKVLFYQCSNVESVELPDSVTYIGNNTFASCTSLTEIELPKNLEQMDTSAFAVTGLTHITIPDSVTSIGDSVFYRCNSLTSVKLGKSLSSIGAGAFRETGIMSIYIPESVTSIGKYGVGYNGISSVPDVQEGFVIVGESDSYAQTYAEENGILFETQPVYDLIIDGVAVTGANCEDILGNGVFAYENGVLTINGDYNGENDTALIKNGIQGLTVRVAGDSVLTSCSSGMITTTDMTIEGDHSLTIDCPGSGIITEEDLAPENTLTIQNLSLKVNGAWPLSGNGDTRLVVDNADIYAVVSQESNGFAIGTFTNGIDLNGCTIVLPKEGAVKDGKIVDSYGGKVQEVIIEKPVEYDLWIKDTIVTDKNCADILGDGSFSFDPEKLILTIKKSVIIKDEWIVASKIDNLIIETAGDETIILKVEKEGIPIYLYGNTTIRGTAGLVLIGTGGIALEQDCNLTLDHINLSIYAKILGIFNYSSLIYEQTFSQLKIDGCNLLIDVSTEYEDSLCAIGGFDVDSGIILKDCSITVPENASIANGFIMKEDDTYAMSVQITSKSAGTWKHDQNGWWYQNADKTYPKNQWKKIDGKWYHFDENGYMQTGWYKEGSTYYYLKSDGSMACDEWVENDKYYLDANGKWIKGKAKENEGGWKQDKNGWWYQNADKSYPKNQWKQIDGKWYHFDKNGYMQTGWYQEGSTYYYLKSDGSMACDEWVENDKYYLDANGKWVKDKVKEQDITGTWKQDKNGWWYQYSDKSYPKNQWVKIGGSWYHFDEEGYMKVGWSKIGRDYYYFKADGSMAADEWIDEEKYYVDANGRWIKDAVKEE